MTRTSQIGDTSLGFTILEMLVVLTIIGILTAMAIPLYSKVVPRLKMMSETHDLLLDLRHAHKEATSQGRTVKILFNSDQKTYVFDDRRHYVKSSISILLPMLGEQQLDGVSAICFYSDGSASAASIVMSDNGRKTNLNIDGLTGLAKFNGD